MVPDIETPPQHSKRVEAWVYAVLNPVLESLQRESSLLSKGNLSWRYHSRECEYIRPIREYVRIDQRPNYEDFVSDQLNTGFLGRFEAHDRALGELELSANQFASGLIHADLFVKKMQESLKEYESFAQGNPLYWYNESMQESFPRAVAELLVNRIEVLPEHYGTAKFWEKYRERFDLSSQEFEPYGQRHSFRALVQTRDALHDLADKLLVELSTHRQSLCRTYDIPAAPIPQDRIVGHSADAFII
jgi:hypothetical protein